MDGTLKWYDSNWLQVYFAAKEVIARAAPSRLPEFVDSFRILRTDPQFTLREIPGFLDDETRARVKAVIDQLPRETWEMYEFKRFGRIIVHDHPEFTKLQSELTGRVSDLVGEAVEPSYNFLSLYTQMGICEPHLDAPSAKWTLDMCIDQSEPWPIHFSQIVPWPEGKVELEDDWQQAIKDDPNLKFTAKVLHPGDAIVFSGSSQWHYRDRIPESGKKGFCNLLFFHFIPEGTAEIVYPRNWARIFDVPELATMPDLEVL